jgi:ankyrin repeat protein
MDHGFSHNVASLRSVWNKKSVNKWIKALKANPDQNTANAYQRHLFGLPTDVKRLIEKYINYSTYYQDPATLAAAEGQLAAFKAMPTFTKLYPEIYLRGSKDETDSYRKEYDPLAPDDHNLTPQVIAGTEGQLNIIEHLATLPGFVYNKEDARTHNMVQEAIDEGHVHIMEWLEEKGYITDWSKHLSPTYDRQFTAATRAARHDHVHILQWLLDKGVDVHAPDGNDSDALFESVYLGAIKSFWWLQEHGQDAVKRCHDDPHRNNGVTAITVACRGGELESLKALVEVGVDYTSKDKLNAGNSPLEAAVRFGHIHIYDYLLTLPPFERPDGTKVAVDKDALTNDKFTLPTLAAQWGHVDLVKHFHDKNHFDLNALDGRHTADTALTIAAYCNQVEVVKYLMHEAKVDPRAHDQGVKAYRNADGRRHTGLKHIIAKWLDAHGISY